MEGLSQITTKHRLPVTITIHGYLRDHRFLGKPVFPAVEAMEVLASSTNRYSKDLSVNTITNARFDKFLYIKEDDRVIDAINDLEVHGKGGISATLSTRFRSKTGSITRIKDHASLHFPGTNTDNTDPPQQHIYEISALEGRSFNISSKKLYCDLVPFGRAFCNVKGDIFLTKKGALARITAPLQKSTTGTNKVLGSPFPLDAAFHIACAWGQRFSNIVAFPLGFDKRVIYKPTQSGKDYICRVFPVLKKNNPQDTFLTFDLVICDLEGVLREALFGLKMGDVSSGKIKPPNWVRW